MRDAGALTAGTPTEALTHGRNALLAIGLNGQPLPTEHGYPARLVVPGLYGYVSATKWVVDLELTRFDKAQAYWTRQGWAARPRLLLTDHRDDLPLIEVCNRTAWFGPEAALAQLRQILPEADIIYCGAGAVVSLAWLGSAVPGTLSSVSA